jgi:hypothetical protein
MHCCRVPELESQASFILRRNTGFDDAKAAIAATGSLQWEILKEWDELQVPILERHKAEMAQLHQNQGNPRMGIQRQWKADSVEQRDGLLRAHLLVFEAFVLFPKQIRDHLILSELNLDPLDSDESLLRAFHRRHAAIKRAAARLR